MELDAGLKSYTSLRTGMQQRLVDVRSGLRTALEDPNPRVTVMIERLRRIEAALANVLGGEMPAAISSKSARRLFPQMIYFSRANRVTGIDLDVLVSGFDLAGYWHMARRNGPLRFVKTMARKALGYDARYRRAFARQLGLNGSPSRCASRWTPRRCGSSRPVRRGAVVFGVRAPARPGRVLEEVRRVLRPGGVAYISIHLYTCDNGCHDPRLFGADREGLPLWAHLRPAHAHEVQPNAYLNKLRLPQWVDLFNALMPGTQFERHCYGGEAEQAAAAELRRQGELAGYTDEELFTVDLAALWRKPPARDIPQGWPPCGTF